MNPYVISRTDPLFEEAALRAVGHWRFAPGRHHGRVVRFKMAVPIVFRMNEATS
jgi:outer membrane biosynthesis protein TonB